MNPFLDRIEKGVVRTPAQLTAHYKALVKRTHPDLNPDAVSLDFDQLKRDYREALSRLETVDRTPNPKPARTGIVTRDAYWDEFRNLVARGFPVNTQAASRNRAYSGSVRTISEYLDQRLNATGFFDQADTEARALKRSHPKTHWYVLQIFWTWSDWHLTGFAYYRRTAERHLAFIRDTLAEEGFPTLLRLLDDHVSVF